MVVAWVNMGWLKIGKVRWNWSKEAGFEKIGWENNGLKAAIGRDEGINTTS